MGDTLTVLVEAEVGTAQEERWWLEVELFMSKDYRMMGFLSSVAEEGWPRDNLSPQAESRLAKDLGFGRQWCPPEVFLEYERVLDEAKDADDSEKRNFALVRAVVETYEAFSMGCRLLFERH